MIPKNGLAQVSSSNPTPPSSDNTRPSAPTSSRGCPPSTPPNREAARPRVVQLRKQNYSVYDIQRTLRLEKVSISHELISQILDEEGFTKLPRRRDEERPILPRPDVAEVADVRQLDWSKFAQFETEGTALFVFLPL